MNAAAQIASILPKPEAERVLALADKLTEIRLRAQKPVQLVFESTDEFIGDAIAPLQLRKIALLMMEHSYYAREDELKRGFFTLKSGCRVGVCGSYSVVDGEICSMQAIGSLCIRIAREVKGCAESLVSAIMVNRRVENTLIISRPGMGKTTLLRDAARLLSESGLCVGVVDERHEIAACREGVPTLDVGIRTDVIDGCPKHLAMERLIRSMAPDVILTDEIGDVHDARAVREAARRGISVLTTAHAGSFEDLRHGGVLRELTEDGTFQCVALLDGTPGNISDMRRGMENGGMVWS